ncbi:MAG: hypothetical protein ACI9Y7_001894 [Dokdonia sp.]|jgi:hypothetical protein
MSNTYKNVLLLFLATLCILNCTSPKEEMGLIGIWETYEDDDHNKTVVTFYKDSVITELFGGAHRTNSNWTIDSSKIYFTNIKLLDTILSDVTYDYNINKTNDSLDLRFLENGKRRSVLFKKANTNVFQDNN